MQPFVRNRNEIEKRIICVSTVLIALQLTIPFQIHNSRITFLLLKLLLHELLPNW